MKINILQNKLFKKNLKLFLRIAISIILIIFVASQIDLKDTLNQLLSANLLVIFICILLYLLCQSISAYKWNVISSAIGFKKSLVDYVQYYFIGMFFNLFLPSTIGGDVGKAYYLSKDDEQGRKAPAIYTVIAERFSGLTVLSWLGTIAILTTIGDSLPFIVKIIAVLLSISITIGAPIFPIFLKTFFKPDNWLNKSLMKDVKVFWHYKIVLQCLIWSLVFHCIVVLIHMLISYSLNLNVNPFYYVAVYPIVAIIGFLPIAFNGIGVREGSYIYFLGLVGIPQTSGFAFGVLWFVIILTASLIGGLFYVKGTNHQLPANIDSTDFNLEEISEEEEFNLTNSDDKTSGKIIEA